LEGLGRHVGGGGRLVCHRVRAAGDEEQVRDRDEAEHEDHDGDEDFDEGEALLRARVAVNRSGRVAHDGSYGCAATRPPGEMVTHLCIDVLFSLRQTVWPVPVTRT